LALLTIFVLAAMPAAANNKKTQRRWVSANTPPPVQRVLVAGVVPDYVSRQEFEDEMKRRLARVGVEGVQSYIVAPPKNEMMDRELKQRLDESSFDSVLVVRPVRKDSQPSDKHSIYLPPSSYNSFWPYWNKAYGDSNPAASYNKQDAPVRLEFNLYSTKTEKLVWSGETDVLSAKDLEGLNKNYARTIVNFLKKDKIVRK
jgi:hypothetical protein